MRILGKSIFGRGKSKFWRLDHTWCVQTTATSPEAGVERVRGRMGGDAVSEVTGPGDCAFSRPDGEPLEGLK